MDKEWETLEKILAWQLTEVTIKKEVIDEARRKCRKVHFASLMGRCHIKNSESEPQYQKNKCRVVLRGGIVKDDSGSYAVFTEQGSSASQMTAAKVMDNISRNGRSTDVIEKSNVRMSRLLDSSTTTQMAEIVVQYGRPSCSS